MTEKYLKSRFLTLYIIPFLLGSLTIFSFEPFSFLIINLIVFPIFFYLLVFINKKSKSIYRKKPYKKNLFIFGMAFGFGFYLCGLSWITNSLTFDENLKVFIPFAFIFIPLFLSIFVGITTLFVGPYLKMNFPSLLLFSFGLALSDFMRSIMFTGFPWNLWAYSTISIKEILQIVNYVGLYSYNLFVITIFTLPIIFFFRIDKIKKLFMIIMSIFTVFSFYIYGNYEINKNKKFLENFTEKTYVKVISPKFNLEYGLNSNEIEERLKKLIRYSNPNKDKKTLFVWPEGVFSGYSYDQIFILKNLFFKNFSNKHHIIFGVNELTPDSGSYYNSLIIVDNNLKIIQSYHKRKLVPFGEFLPFENILNNFGLKKITEGHGSFLRGSENKNLEIDNLSIIPLICYEIIFSDLIRKSYKKSNLIVNISEDGWFGNTIGPDQHFSKSIFRAIENNTFLLRSANRGISAIIDNKGNVIKRLNRNEAGNIEFEVPLITSNKIKNDLIFFILLFTYLLIFFIYERKNAK